MRTLKCERLPTPGRMIACRTTDDAFPPVTAASEHPWVHRFGIVISVGVAVLPKICLLTKVQLSASTLALGNSASFLCGGFSDPYRHQHRQVAASVSGQRQCTYSCSNHCSHCSIQFISLKCMLLICRTFESLIPGPFRTIHQRYDFLLSNATLDMVSRRPTLECPDNRLIDHLEVCPGRAISRELPLRGFINTGSMFHHARTASWAI